MFFIVCFAYSVILFAEEPLFFYVNAGNTRGAQKGTSDSPFVSLEQAIAAVYEYMHLQKKADPLPATIYLQSDVFIEEALFLTLPLKIKGIGNPVLSFGDNAGFVIEKTFFEISDCVLKRTERMTEPRMVPIFYGGQGSIVLHHVSVIAQEGGETAILRRSRFFCFDSSFHSKQSAQALLIRADASFMSVLRSSFTAQGVNAVCFELTDSECTLQETECHLFAHYTGRSAELVRSNMAVKYFQAFYKSPLFNKIDAAIIADKHSSVTLANKPLLNGFSKFVLQRK